jgi:hypothetical protein
MRLRRRGEPAPAHELPAVSPAIQVTFTISGPGDKAALARHISDAVRRDLAASRTGPGPIAQMFLPPERGEPPRNVAIRIGQAWYEMHRQLTTHRAGSPPPEHVAPVWDDLDVRTRADWANVAAALLAQQVISAP